jgi:eukaryotic-like serine/threonine-protein kinase
LRETFRDRLRNIVPSRYDDPDVRLFKIIIYTFVGAVLLMIIAGLTSFFVSLRGAEETMVPDVRNEDLLDAMLVLQERGITAEVEVRFSADPALAGKVIAQSPPAGTLVRAGKIMDLVVSRGARIDRVGTYIGRTLVDIRAELRALFATGDQTIQIGDVSYVFNELEAGRVLAQDPPPATDITSIIRVDLVVSRGPDVERLTVPSFIGLPFELSITRLSQASIPFVFEIRDAEPDEQTGLVMSQDPAPQTEVTMGEFVTLTMTRPAVVPDGFVFGLYDRALPEYTVSVDLTLESQAPGRDREVLVSMLHPGIRFSVPYIVPVNSALILSRSGQEILRSVVRPETPAEDDGEGSNGN